MKIKTSELTGAALDWAVAKCEGIHWAQGDLDAREYGPGFKPSTSWKDGGPIIERERIKLEFDGAEGFMWWGYHPVIDDLEHGLTPLIAAMRCFVASKLGDEVDVPDELKE